MKRQRTHSAGSARLLLCALLAGLLLACGNDPATDDRAEDPTSSDATSDTMPADAPSCADVWLPDATIPRSYQGCAEDDGTYTERDVLGCSSGQRMVRHADRFYGVLGGTVHETETSLADDPDYQDAVARCRA